MTGFDWGAVEWATVESDETTTAALQKATIGPNTWMRVTVGGEQVHRSYGSTRAEQAYGRIVTAEDRAEALARLRERVTPGMQVKVENHDYLAGSSEGAVTKVTPTRLELVNKKGEASWLGWPDRDDDYEVRFGENRASLLFFNPDHAYAGGRACTLACHFDLPAEAAPQKPRRGE